jgi:anti-sigma B factor antagonist
MDERDIEQPARGEDAFLGAAGTLRRSARGGMKISTRASGAATIFVLSEPARDGDAARFGTSFKSFLAAGRRFFVLDLSTLAYIDSLLLAEVIAALKRAKERSGTVALVSARRSKVREILRITALDRVFRIHDTLAQALASVEEAEEEGVRK